MILIAKKRLLKVALDRDLDAGRVLGTGLAVDPAEGLVAVRRVVRVADVPVLNGLRRASLDGDLCVVDAGEEGELVVGELDVLAVAGARVEDSLGDVGRGVGDEVHGRVDGEVWRG